MSVDGERADAAYQTADPTPSVTGVGLTLAFGTAAVVAVAIVPAAALACLLGVAVAGVAVRRGSRRLLTLGTLVAFGGVVLAGTATGASGTPRVLAAGAATVVAWDVGENAVDVGRQLGRGARTVEIEAVHALTSALFATAVAAGAWILYGAVRGDAPTPAVVALIVAAVALAWALDR